MSSCTKSSSSLTRCCLVLIVLACFASSSNALKCIQGGDWKHSNPNCDKDPNVLNICYFGKDGTQGCIPKEHGASVFMENACDGMGHGCWCNTNNCNTLNWYNKFKKSWKAPPQCYGGIAGSNEGATCSETTLYKTEELESVDCHSKLLENVCVENNPWFGQGDGCPDDGRRDGGKEKCESYRNGDRDAEDSYDGTTKHCLWLPKINNYKAACESQKNADGSTTCKYNKDDNQCYKSDATNKLENEWNLKKGRECEIRIANGCYENNDHMGQAQRCTGKEDKNSCLAVTDEDGCSEGVCIGEKVGPSDQACSDHKGEWECTDPGCQWKKQCCQWVEGPELPMYECEKDGGAFGSTDGYCAYNDGNGAPNVNTVEAGFEHGLLMLGPLFKKNEGCAMIATFRVGFGSGVALGANEVGMLSNSCSVPDTWKSIGEHVGHTDESIDEYCTNFIPEKSAMKALEAYSPGQIIHKVKTGQFLKTFPGLKGLKYIVTSKPEYGECFLIASAGVWGAAICTCDTEGCNGEEALKFIVNPATGPMRLIQFLDGTMSEYAEEINKIMPGTMKLDGTFDDSKVGDVTKSQVEEVLKIGGLSDKTNVEELWGIIQDYKNLQFSEPNVCSGVKKKKDCMKKKQNCSWKGNKCLAKEKPKEPTEPEEPEEPKEPEQNVCVGLKKKKDCMKKKQKCSWKGNKCLEKQAPKEPTEPEEPEEPEEPHVGNKCKGKRKKDCKKLKKNCAWKKNNCVTK